MRPCAVAGRGGGGGLRRRFRSFLIPILHNDGRVNDGGRRPRSRSHNIRFDSRGRGDGAEAQSTFRFKVGGRWPYSQNLPQLTPLLSRTDF